MSSASAAVASAFLRSPSPIKAQGAGGVSPPPGIRGGSRNRAAAASAAVNAREQALAESAHAAAMATTLAASGTRSVSSTGALSSTQSAAATAAKSAKSGNNHKETAVVPASVPHKIGYRIDPEAVHRTGSLRDLFELCRRPGCKKMLEEFLSKSPFLARRPIRYGY